MLEGYNGTPRSYGRLGADPVDGEEMINYEDLANTGVIDPAMIPTYSASSLQVANTSPWVALIAFGLIGWYVWKGR